MQAIFAVIHACIVAIQTRSKRYRVVRLKDDFIMQSLDCVGDSR